MSGDLAMGNSFIDQGRILGRPHAGNNRPRAALHDEFRLLTVRSIPQKSFQSTLGFRDAAMAKRKAAEPQSVTADSFEESLTELQSIVSELEDGSLGLEASLARFERGVGRLRTCYVILESAEQKIETLTRFNDAVQPIASRLESAAPPNQIDNRANREDEASSSDDAATLPDVNTAKSSLF